MLANTTVINCIIHVVGNREDENASVPPPANYVARYSKASKKSQDEDTDSPAKSDEAHKGDNNRNSVWVSG